MPSDNSDARGDRFMGAASALIAKISIDFFENQYHPSKSICSESETHFRA